MKILQAFDFLSLPHGGGTVDIVYKLSKSLAQRGHEVTICTGDYDIDYKYLSELSGAGLRIYHSYFNKHGIYLMFELAQLDIRDYDVIHFHCYRSFQNIVLTNKARRHHIPYIIDSHGSTVSRTGSKVPILTTYDRLFGRSMIEHASLLVAETGVGFAEWEQLGAGFDRIRLQHPLLDTSEFDMLPERGSFREWYKINDSPIVLFLGRIHHAKGIDTLLQAFHSFTQGRDAKLVIVGQDDGYRSTLEDMAIELGIQDRVLFTGYLSGVHKLAALVDAAVLVQPSRNEAGARPSLEAIMVGTPVIVSRDTGAGQEIAKFDGGLLFKSGDVDELVNAVREVIDNPAGARARTDKARRYIIDNLSFTNGITGYEILYQEAMKQRREL
jgi:glycosyltransferase involved in cell wall biosynthesis